MALNIKDPETDRLVRRLAEVTGEKMTDAVRIAVGERLERVAQRRGKASLDELLAIANRVASKPVVDPRRPRRSSATTSSACRLDRGRHLGPGRDHATRGRASRIHARLLRDEVEPCISAASVAETLDRPRRPHGR